MQKFKFVILVDFDYGSDEARWRELGHSKQYTFDTEEERNKKWDELCDLTGSYSRNRAVRNKKLAALGIDQIDLIKARIPVEG